MVHASAIGDSSFGFVTLLVVFFHAFFTNTNAVGAKSTGVFNLSSAARYFNPQNSRSARRDRRIQQPARIIV